MASDVIFADGFESGNLSAWSASVTDGGDLSVMSGGAALVGGSGLQAVIERQPRRCTCRTTTRTPRPLPGAVLLRPEHDRDGGQGTSHYILVGYQAPRRECCYVQLLL